ncbi:MAG: hypothetical protein KDK36_17620 [Leptospiraceae bacterium]|nr:hypothetical protein [Leptospiraceae bacterium]
MKALFTEDELNKIKNTVKETEKSTSAEVVPVFYRSSGIYSDTYWKSGILFATFWSFLFFIYLSQNNKWGISLQFFFLTQMTAGLIGVAFNYLFPFWRRLLLDRKIVKKTVQDLAYRVFLEEEVFLTKNRIGILIFMSFFEKEAVILGDKGINKIIKEDTWEGIISRLISDMKTKDKTDAIVQTIQSLGNLLTQYPIEAGDINELKDDLRLGDVK